jgi:hypothetical protein
MRDSHRKRPAQLVNLMLKDVSTGRQYLTRAEQDPLALRAKAPSDDIAAMIEAALGAVDDPAAKQRLSIAMQAALNDAA